MKNHPKGVVELENFRLLQMDNSEDEEVLNSLGLPRLRGFDVFENIINYVKERLSCKSVLVEEKYIDKDYRNEYSNLYSKAFAKYDSYTKRIHFFGTPITTFDYFRNFNAKPDTANYLGYMVLRPTNVGKVGRTILSSHKESDDTFYPLCTADFKVHLFGHEFSINEGSPFMSQDTMVMACAQASIWSAALYLHQKFNFARYLPFEITENASKALGWTQRTVPTEGLTVLQMVNAFNNMKYFPILCSRPIEAEYINTEEYKEEEKGWNPIEDIYSYIESRIPVIMSIPQHAITVIGHTFNPKSTSLKEKIKEKIKKYKKELKKENGRSSEVKLIFSSSILVNGFIVQDDSIGPYRILPIRESDYEYFKNNANADLLPPEDYNYKSIDDIDHIIVPLPEKIYLLGDNAYNIAEKIIQMDDVQYTLAKSLDKGNKHVKEIIISMDPENDPPNPIIIRCYFMDSSEYKKAILSGPLCRTLHKEVKSEYLKMSLPHYVWIAEITTANRLCAEKEDERLILGEILIDSTANKYDMVKACLSIHLPGFLQIQNQKEGIFNKTIFLDEDKPYRHLSRKSK